MFQSKAAIAIAVALADVWLVLMINGRKVIKVCP